MNKEIPRIDLPQDWVIGELSKEDIHLLQMYANFPCRLKAGIFVLCMQGDFEASVNLARLRVKPGSFITLLPGTIFQIHQAEGELKVYFMGFSSKFIQQTDMGKTIVGIHYAIKENPIIELKEQACQLLKDYFCLLENTYNLLKGNIDRKLLSHLFSGIFLTLSTMYKDKTKGKGVLSKSELISKNFTGLVIQNYINQRNVAWYAQQLGITQSHLSTIVKQVTGKTCTDIITSMVIMDAKAQLKQSDLSIHDIAHALNFSNMSFFGKFFKRHVGMGPQEYRNS